MTDKEKCQVIAKKKDCRDFRCNECPLVRGKWNCSKAKYVHQAAIQWLKDHPDECEAKGEEKAMEKTDSMKKIEQEVALPTTIQPGTFGWAYVSELEKQLEEAQAKASAYDRIMSGGRKTLKEWANIFGMPFVVDKEGRGYTSKQIPELWEKNQCWYSKSGLWAYVPACHIDFNGDWTTSLTLPDGWEEK